MMCQCSKVEKSKNFGVFGDAPQARVLSLNTFKVLYPTNSKLAVNVSTSNKLVN